MRMKLCVFMFKMNGMAQCFLKITSECITIRNGDKVGGGCSIIRELRLLQVNLHLIKKIFKMSSFYLSQEDNLSTAVCTDKKMSIVNLDSMSNDELKKRVASLVSLEDWADECSKC